jgi:HAD superfamily hydrolase (TIGR01509 family)
MSPHANEDSLQLHPECTESLKLSKALKNAKALVFDCDGTLLDTMPIYYLSWKRTCDEVGLSFPVERFYQMAGMPVVDIFRILIQERSRNTKFEYTAEELDDKKKKHHADIEREGYLAEPINAVVEIAKHFYKKIPMAVASSSWRDHVLEGLRRANILHLFETVVTADEDEVRKGKPAPDIFLVAAQRLGVDPKHAIGFEDADLGIQSVNAAGYLLAVDVREMFLYPRNVEERVRMSKSIAN